MLHYIHITQIIVVLSLLHATPDAHIKRIIKKTNLFAVRKFAVIFASEGARPVSTTLVANLPPASTTLVENSGNNIILLTH
jgi:hypothetical protein